MTKAVATKGDGRFVAGVSGNPHGRPLTKRQSINDQQMTIEAAIRKKIAPDQIIKAVEMQVKLAAAGDTKAAAVIMPYFLTKPTGEDKDPASGTQIVIKVENATLFAQNKEQIKDSPPSTVIDGEFTEVKPNG
jgi:hypothetical protein